MFSLYILNNGCVKYLISNKHFLSKFALPQACGYSRTSYLAAGASDVARRRYSQKKNVERVSLESFVGLGNVLEPLADNVFQNVSKKSKSRNKKETVPIITKKPDIPQGLIQCESMGAAEPLAEPSLGAYPTVVQQALNNMRKFEGCVVLTRVGSFYELYFDQAEEYAPLLNIKLASKRTNAGLVPMAGFPFFQLDRFLKILVQELGKHVAISEEVANEPARKVKSGGLLFDRQVKRVVTPGTLIDENFLRPHEHNYLLAIYLDNVTWDEVSAGHLQAGKVDARVGLSWLDLSSGDFFTQSTGLNTLSSAVARISPREIILDRSFQQSEDNRVAQWLKQDAYAMSFCDLAERMLDPDELFPALEDAMSSSAAADFTPEETNAANLLLRYTRTQLPGFKMRLQAPIRREVGDCMTIDRNSLRSLEIIETLRDGLFKGSLLQAIRRTSTASGARLLTQRLTFPSMSLSEIGERLDLVEELIQNDVLLEEAMRLLRQASDILRLLQKFSFGRGDADDLLQLCRTVKVTENAGNILRTVSCETLPGLARLCTKFEFEGPRIVADRILQAIDEEGLILRQRSEDATTAETLGQARDVLSIEGDSTSAELNDLRKSLATKRFNKIADKDAEKPDPDEIWVMRRNATPTLERLHERLSELLTAKNKLEFTLREQLNADSLSLKFTPGFGHICHVKGKDMKLDLATLSNARTVGSTKSTRSFYWPEWTRLGASIEDARLRIRKEEQLVFQMLRDLVIQNLVVLRKNAAVLDDLDVACSSATLAVEHNLKRPNLNHGSDHSIYGGRHLTVELGLAESGRQFISNDCVLNEEERIWLITGPNMAGKSTFLRQTALISIIAQTGMYVPADFVKIGLVDQIFSRVGSADNLSQDQSTFMVEMLETAHILRNATPRSFVIMDEVGRGTTPEDGIAVGYAVLHQLQHVNKCRTLFATHFHALADMTQDFPSLACYCTNVVDEPGGSFRYDHRLRQGVNRQSHALKVAMLADMPTDVIEKAGQVLEQMKAAN